MKRLLWAAAALLIAATAQAAPIFQQGDTVVNEDGTPQSAPQSPVVQLRVAFGEKICTGFYVGNRMIVTAGHCYWDADQPDQYVAVLDNGKELTASILYASDPHANGTDTAILHIDDAVPDGWVPDQVDCAYAPKMGDDVSTLGFPAANQFALTFSKGYVNGPTMAIAAWASVIPITMPISPGHSGSPVYHDGKASGILVGENTQQLGWSYVQPIKPICGLLGR